MIAYPALFDPDPEAGGYVVTFPDFAYGATQGETVEEATLVAEDLLRCTIMDFITQDKKLPKPSSPRGLKYRHASPPALQAAKVALYVAFRHSGIRKSELARRTRISKSNIDRLFDLHHASRLDQIECAFRALGKKLVVDVQDAAA